MRDEKDIVVTRALRREKEREDRLTYLRMLVSHRVGHGALVGAAVYAITATAGQRRVNVLRACYFYLLLCLCL